MKSRGFSLVEMLLAVTLGMLLLLSFSTLFFHYHHVIIRNHALAEAQDSIRFISFYLQHSTQTAGFVGCPRLSKDLKINNYGVELERPFSDEVVFQIFEGQAGYWTPPLPHDFHLTPKPGTDVILSRARESTSSELLETVTHTNRLLITGNFEFQPGDDVILSDCHHVALAHIRSSYVLPGGTSQEVITSEKIDETFNRGAEIGLLRTHIFFIQPSEKKDAQGKPIDALYEINETKIKSELATTIKNLKVTCYLNDDQRKLRILSPSQVTDWKTVRAIRVDLTFSKPSSLYISLMERSLGEKD